MKNKYWIIDLDGFGMTEVTRTAHGPFKSVADAEKWLKEDAGESFASFNEPQNLGPQLDWSAPVLIVEEKKRLQQVPVVGFEIKLEKLK
ncbi:MAG: hypothetical protein EBY32_10840 [Proteobacteria bacterium]|nr:hypothetical protein [Pseudomonadota bacterium]